MRVLLSIKPSHAANILSGVKTFEYRRRMYGRKEIRTALVYATKPVGRLVAEFDIENVLEATPEELWAVTHYGSGISKSYFDAYFCGRGLAYALQIGEVRVFDKPIAPHELFTNFTAPQSYMYVPRAHQRGENSLQLSLL